MVEWKGIGENMAKIGTRGRLTGWHYLFALGRMRFSKP